MINETNPLETTTTSPSELLKLIALDLRYRTITAYKNYKQYQSIGKEHPKYNSMLISNINSEFLYHYAAIDRTIKPKDFKELNELIESQNIKDVIKAWLIIIKWTDSKNITRIDTRHKEDTTLWEDD